MATDESQQACDYLLRVLIEQARQSPGLSNSPYYVASCTALKDVVSSSTPDGVRRSIDVCMDNLTKYFDFVSLQQQRQLDDDDDPTFSIFLAKVTRESPFWRPRFGKPPTSSQVSTEQQQKQEEQHTSESILPDCILEVARRLIARASVSSWDESRREHVRSALRLIANCCADNDANRDIIVKRNGIRAMLLMASSKKECGLLIPTMFNVCYQYRSPALAEDGTPLPLLHETGEHTHEHEVDDAGEPTVNLAEQKLAITPIESVPGQRISSSSIEILLGMLPSAERCIGLLADLVEMASHMALYGLSHIIALPRTLENDSEDQRSQHLKESCSRLLKTLLAKGTKIIKDEQDTQLSICQAALNVLSQPESHEAIISFDASSAALWSLIHLPYIRGDDEDDDDDGQSSAAEHENIASETLAPFRKAFLKLVYQISSLEPYAEQSDPDSKLVRDCIEALGTQFRSDKPSTRSDGIARHSSDAGGLWASMCVLVANSIISTARAVRLLESTGLARVVCNILKQTSDKELVLPAVDVATRLALSPEGQDALCERGLFSVVRRRLLTPTPTGATDALGVEIQRQSVTLARLLIKDRLATNFSSGLAPEPGERSTTTTLLTLFEATKDVRTRTEIGRFYIEILRTGFKSSQTSLPSSSQASEGGELLPGIICCPDPSLTATVADAIAFIVTQPQSQDSTTPSTPSNLTLRTEAEAWFGLGLMSTIPNARSEIIATLSRNDQELLKALETIVHRNNPIRETGTETDDIVLRSNSNTAPNDDDPRYKNIRVLVVNLLGQNPDSDRKDGGKVVENRIRKAAVMMGLGNVPS
ncbi:hypothetical protein H2204_006711 [Knufia peltigerae]|uniref:ARM repeat superfamily protein n=1 Tax=Knufia peltigerae TaxID=1002370 RepID=A0AA38Y318_9EURO|nr:hypothetical protein H2204_006711 [Knufia peltigerae]